MKHKYTLEVCVDSVESAIAAEKGGATRLELCSNLIIGGTSPSIELFKSVKKYTNIPINILIRPRFGDFCYSNFEYEIIKNETKMFKEAGTDGIVIGLLKPDGYIDIEKMNELITIAEDIHITLHRAFDVCLDPFKTLEDAKQLGINSILTSGQKNHAINGVDTIKKLLDSCDDIEILIGSGVNTRVVKEFLNYTSASAFHMSGKTTTNSNMIFRKNSISMGLPILSEYDIWRTEENNIMEVKELLEEYFI